MQPRDIQLLSLPDEILLLIVTCLNFVEDVQAVGGTCKRLHNIAKDRCVKKVDKISVEVRCPRYPDAPVAIITATQLRYPKSNPLQTIDLTQKHIERLLLKDILFLRSEKQIEILLDLCLRAEKTVNENCYLWFPTKEARAGFRKKLKCELPKLEGSIVMVYGVYIKPGGGYLKLN